MNPSMPAEAQLDMATRAEAPSSEKNLLAEWSFTSGESLIIHSNKDHTSSKKAYYPLAFLPANSRIACLQMNSAHSDQIKASKIQSALTTVTYEAQQINQTMTHSVVAMPELKGKLLRLAQIVAYAYSLLEPEMRLLAQNHNYNTSLNALEVIVESRKVVPPRFQQSLTKSYLSCSEYIQAVAKLPVKMGELATLWLAMIATVFQAGRLGHNDDQRGAARSVCLQQPSGWYAI